MARQPSEVQWLGRPEEHDFDAAFQYLTLIWTAKDAKGVVMLLRESGKRSLEARKAKDILRASRLELLPAGNKHVSADLEKVRSGKKLSPVLLVVDARQSTLVIADGYHRVCASYWVDENTDIPCVLA